MVKEIQIDVESKQLALIKKILKRHITYKTVWAYGSRVNWTANQYSDLDLVVFDANTVKLGELKEDFAESDLPFTVDVMPWGKIPEKFKNKILEKYVVLQKKPQLEGWKECKLGDILAEKGYIRGPFGSSLKRAEMAEKGIPVYEQKNAIYNSREFRFYIDNQKFQELKRFQVKTNDLIISCSGTVGKISIINEDDPKGIISQALLILRPDIDKVTLKYLYYFLSSKNGFNLITQASHGSVQINIAERKVVENILILLPQLIPEQKAIASVLSSLDDKIDLLHRQNKTLEAMAETLFRQWFVEEAKEDWEEGCLGDIADINPTYQLKKGENSTYLEMKNVNASTFNPAGWYKREFTSGMKFQNGDTLLARITPCLENGKTCFVTFLDEGEIGWGSTEYIVIRMKELFHPYVSYIIAKDKDFRDFAISSMSGSSGRQRAQANVIKEYDIKIPPLEIIEELNRQLAGTLQKLKNNANQIRTLEKLRDTLLPKLMSGEVMVENNKEKSK
jgi:type I restriction enzyme S subunit